METTVKDQPIVAFEIAPAKPGKVTAWGSHYTGSGKSANRIPGPPARVAPGSSTIAALIEKASIFPVGSADVRFLRRAPA